jgi:hypothetical protein
MLVTIGGVIVVGLGVGVVTSSIAENAAEKRGDIELADSIAFFTKVGITVTGIAGSAAVIVYACQTFLGSFL